jgi:hypothetical protein
MRCCPIDSPQTRWQSGFYNLIPCKFSDTGTRFGRLKPSPKKWVGKELDSGEFWKPIRPDDSEYKPQPVTRDSPYDLLSHIAVDEACNFYYACLFHIGRMLSSVESRLNAIDRLLDRRNLDKSSSRIHKSLGSINRLEIRELLRTLCASEAKQQEFRKRTALDCWEQWRQSVLKLRTLLHSENSLISTDLGAGVSFLLVSRAEADLLTLMGRDRLLFRAVPIPSVLQRLKIIESSPVRFSRAFSSIVYWKTASKKSVDFEKSTRDYSHPKFDGVPGRFAVQFDHSGDIRPLLHKMSKLFLVHGIKPPIWPEADVEAKRPWVARSLDRAGLSAKFIIDNFAEVLLRFSDETSSHTPSFPLADIDWDDYLNAFFNTCWVPSLRDDLKNLNPEQFRTFVQAAARLLGAMGYSVEAPIDTKLPPGAGQKTNSDYFPRSSDLS